ncbi:hypothetical protein BJ508DRAFT_330217 [Ascobolus immersus RN42]|uniref:Uncharacterized protein n=1 Tax=Ascobolus immersus RN42 TaxID=1160509 RepID=A0A3N4HZJ7_ASCIM|nr:hypothetical protein BJ508DRAFT_330217 [Ascobolus immersus RN42]
MSTRLEREYHLSLEPTVSIITSKPPRSRHPHRQLPSPPISSLRSRACISKYENEPELLIEMKDNQLKPYLADDVATAQSTRIVLRVQQNLTEGQAPVEMQKFFRHVDNLESLRLGLWTRATTATYKRVNQRSQALSQKSAMKGNPASTATKTRLTGELEGTDENQLLKLSTNGATTFAEWNVKIVEDQEKNTKKSGQNAQTKNYRMVFTSKAAKKGNRKFSGKSSDQGVPAAFCLAALHFSEEGLEKIKSVHNMKSVLSAHISANLRYTNHG